MRIYENVEWIRYGEAYWMGKFMAAWAAVGYDKFEYDAVMAKTLAIHPIAKKYIEHALNVICTKFKCTTVKDYEYPSVIHRFLPISIEFRSPTSYTDSTDSFLRDRYMLPSPGDLSMHISGYIGDGYRHISGAGRYDIDTSTVTIGERNAIANGSGLLAGFSNLAAGRGYSYIAGSGNSGARDHVYIFGRQVKVGVKPVVLTKLTAGHTVALCSGCGSLESSISSYLVNGAPGSYSGPVILQSINGRDTTYLVGVLRLVGSSSILDISSAEDITTADLLIPTPGVSVCIGNGTVWEYPFSVANGGTLLGANDNILQIGPHAFGYRVTDREVKIGSRNGFGVGFSIGRYSLGLRGGVEYYQSSTGIFSSINGFPRLTVEYDAGIALMGVMNGASIGTHGRGGYGLSAVSTDISVESVILKAAYTVINAKNLTVPKGVKITSDSSVFDVGTMRVRSLSATGYMAGSFATVGSVDELEIKSNVDMTVSDQGRSMGFLANGLNGQPWTDVQSPKPGFYEHSDGSVELRGEGFSLLVQDDLDVYMTSNSKTYKAYDTSELGVFKDHILDVRVGSYAGDFCTYMYHSSLGVALDPANHGTTVYDRHGVKLNYWTLHNVPIIGASVATDAWRADVNSGISVSKMQFKKVGNIVTYDIEVDILDYYTRMMNSDIGLTAASGGITSNVWMKRCPVVWLRASEWVGGNISQLSYNTLKALCPAGMEARGRGQAINRTAALVKPGGSVYQSTSGGSPIIKFHPMHEVADSGTADRPYGFMLSQGNDPAYAHFIIRFSDDENDMHGLFGNPSHFNHHAESHNARSKSTDASDYTEGSYDSYSEGMGGLNVGRYSFTGMYISDNIIPLDL